MAEKQAKNILKVKNDIVFQSLFNQANEKITKSFVESILEEKVDKIQINETKELFRENPEDKMGALDLELDINDNEKVDVEIQLIVNKNFPSRLLYYFSKLYASTIKVGEDYEKAKRTIIVAILGDDFEITRKLKEMETKWRIMCKNHPELELTNKFEIIIIELNKARSSYLKNKNDPKTQWAMFIEDTESREVEEIMEKNEEIKEAVVTVRKMSEDEKMQRLAYLREKYILEKNSAYSSRKARTEEKSGRKEREKRTGEKNEIRKLQKNY